MEPGSEPLGGFHPGLGLGSLGSVGVFGVFGAFGAFGGAETGDFGLLGDEPPFPEDPDSGVEGLLPDFDDDPEEASDSSFEKRISYRRPRRLLNRRLARP